MSLGLAGSLSLMTVLMEGISFGESPRWHDGRVWFSDWGAHQVIALDPQGGHEVVVSVESFPMCIDFLPDGRLLVVDSAQRRLLRREPDGSMVTHADLAPISEKPWNDIVVDARGNAYVDNIGFDFPGGEPAPGSVVLVTPQGAVRLVADDLAFPNGMAITADGSRLIVAESHGNRLTAYDIGQDGDLANRRTWADNGRPPRRDLCRCRGRRLVRRRG
jgi:sugar lactone lactonase YvrE